MSKIQVENLSVIFGKRVKEAQELQKEGKDKVEILNQTGCTVGVSNANLEIQEGEVFVVMGLSGSGKSTLLRCFNRLIDPTTGSVVVDGNDITKINEYDL